MEWFRFPLRFYFLTVIRLLRLFVPAFPEATLKVALMRPVREGRIRRLTVRVAPGLIVPTRTFELMPLPEATSFTPVARALPELVIFAL